MLAAACGDDDSGTGDAETDAAIQGLRAAIAQSSTADADSPIQMGDAEALCVAEGMFEEFGAARVIEASDQEFEEFMASATAAERRATVDLVLDCADFTSAFAGQLEAEGISGDGARCVADGLLGMDQFRNLVAESMTGNGSPDFQDPAILEVMLPLFLNCLSAEELGNLG